MNSERISHRRVLLSRILPLTLPEFGSTRASSVTRPLFPFFISVLLLTLSMAAAVDDLQRFLNGNSGNPKNSVLRSAVEQQRTSQAFVTLLYGDAFVLGVRVLGQSIKMTNANLDMVVLVSKGVTQEAALLLQADGWIVDRVELLNNPNSHHPGNFWGVYTKLKIFNMTRYDKLVYLDADTIVINDIKELFFCRGFCAALRHSEKFNTGVMVVEPSTELFLDMMTKIEILPSYTGGDQGFLNEYYADFVNSKLFDSNSSFLDKPKEGSTPKMERLPTVYNADVGLFMLANKWMVEKSMLKVIHYTLGPLKPWDWWTEWLVPPVTQWQDIRYILPESIMGSGGGSNPSLKGYIWTLVFFPFFVIILLYRQSIFEIFVEIVNFVKDGQGLGKGRKLKAGCTPFPSLLGVFSVIFCFSTLFFSLIVAFFLVPSQVQPWTGVLLVYEWTFFLFFLIFGYCLLFIRNWGRTSAMKSANEKEEGELKYVSALKGHSRGWSRWDFETFFYFLWIAIMAVGFPSLPYALGITPLFARLGLFVAGGVSMAVVLSVMSEQLARRWYVLGREDWAQLHAHSLCDL